MRELLTKYSMTASFFAAVIAAGSVGYNLVQSYKINQLTTIKELARQKESLMNDSFNEILMNRISEMRENIAEVARAQGKVEGMVAVSMNLNPEQNHTSAIWHEGYYRGVNQAAYVEESAYIAGYHRATEDIGCPASVRDRMNAEAPRKYQQDKQIDVENEQFNKALDEAEKRRKNIESIKNNGDKVVPMPETPAPSTPQKK